MKARSGLGVVLFFLFAAGALAGIVAMQSQLEPHNRKSAEKAAKYVPNRETLELTSFGERAVYADLLWVRAIQYMATPFENADAKYRWLEELFEAITDLDPRFEAAYRYGATYLTLIRRKGDAGVKLLEKGIAANPESWRLPHDLAMIHFVDRRDHVRTLTWLREAVKRRDCPLHVKKFLSALAEEPDDSWTSIRIWVQMIETHENEQIRILATEELYKAVLRLLRSGVESFEEKLGRKPTSLDELLRSGAVSLRDGFDLSHGIEYDAKTGELTSPVLWDTQIKKGLILYNHAVTLYRERFGETPARLNDLRKVLRRMPRHPRRAEGWSYVLITGEQRVVSERTEAAE